MTRVRTIDAALHQLKQDDPGTSLTRHALRQMVLEGRVPCTKIGAKYLLDYDALLSVLHGETAEPEPQYGVIRRIG